jgi:hypothetical protein
MPAVRPRFHLAPCSKFRGHLNHLPEGAVMVAFAMHLLRTVPGLREVSIHPDGEHGKWFDFQGWLGNQGFVMITPSGKTTYGGAARPQVEGENGVSRRVPRAAGRRLLRIAEAVQAQNVLATHLFAALMSSEVPTFQARARIIK